MEEPKTIRVLDNIRFVVNCIIMTPLILLEILCSILMIISTILMRVIYHVAAYWLHAASGVKYQTLIEELGEYWCSYIDRLDKLYHRI